MAKTNSLIARLTRDFPNLTFELGSDYYWSPTSKTVFFVDDNSPESLRTILHETAHGLLNHQEFRRDIDLVRMEREAWHHAQTELSKPYGIPITDEQMEDMLDTYRDWLHSRSTCPNCSMTGFQTDQDVYLCPSCDHRWRVNDARRCGLRRYSLTN